MCFDLSTRKDSVNWPKTSLPAHRPQHRPDDHLVIERRERAERLTWSKVKESSGLEGWICLAYRTEYPHLELQQIISLSVKVLFNPPDWQSPGLTWTKGKSDFPSRQTLSEPTDTLCLSPVCLISSGLEDQLDQLCRGGQEKTLPSVDPQFGSFWL